MRRKHTARLWWYGGAAFVISAVVCSAAVLLTVLVGVGGGLRSQPPLWVHVLAFLALRPFRFDSIVTLGVNALFWSLLATFVTTAIVHLFHRRRPDVPP